MFACITDMLAPAEEAVVVPTSPFPVVLSEEAQPVRTAHPCILVPCEMQEMGCSSTAPVADRSETNCPQIAIFCQPPSPTVAHDNSRSASPAQYSDECRSPVAESAMTEIDEAVAALRRRPVSARLSVPTDGPPRGRTGAASLSRSQSHPLHRQRHRSTPSATNLDSNEIPSPRHHRRNDRLNNVVEHGTS